MMTTMETMIMVTMTMMTMTMLPIKVVYKIKIYFSSVDSFGRDHFTDKGTCSKSVPE